MSFAMTLPALLVGIKDVTRRVGWRDLWIGDVVMAVDKAMGHGGKQVKIMPLRVTAVGRDHTANVTDEDARREGFPHMSGRALARLLARKLRVEMVTRLEFRREDAGDVPAPGTAVTYHAGRRRRLDGVVVAHCQPGKDPRPLVDLCHRALALGTSRRAPNRGSSDRVRPVVLRTDGVLVVPRLVDRHRGPTIASVVREFTTCADVRRLAEHAETDGRSSCAV